MWKFKIIPDLLIDSTESNKIICFTAVMASQSQLISNYLPKITTDVGFSNYHKQYLLLIKDKQKLYQNFYCN